MKHWTPAELAARVTLIGKETPAVVDLSYFAALKGKDRRRRYITTDFSVVPYSLGQPIEVPDLFVTVNGKEVPLILGYRYVLPNGAIVDSYDHHGPDMRLWSRSVSSAPLSRIRVLRLVKPFTHVYLSHTDADSILSAFILLTCNADHRLSEAAIVADHIGAENLIADVLQAIMDERDVLFSFTCLDALLFGGPLPDRACVLLRKRLDDRERASRYVSDGLFKDVGNGVYVAHFEDKLPGELLPPLIPAAKVIILVSNMKEEGVKEIKVRAGLCFPEGMSLNSIGLPYYDGRWDAGGTKRHGGTPEDKVLDFIEMVVRAMESPIVLV